MNVKNISSAVVCVCLAIFCPSLAAAAPDMTIRYGHVAKPDADLVKMVETLKKDLARGKAGKRAVEKAFAAKVTAFTRGLNPLEPWNPIDPVTKDPLDGLSDFMVEKGEMVDANGNSVMDTTDYRINAMEMMLLTIGDDAPYGTMEQVPGAICKPAAWQVNVAAVKEFAKAHDSDGSAGPFYTTEVKLMKKPSDTAKVAAVVPPYTMMYWVFEKDMPDGWDRYYATNGATGYLFRREDHQSMSQNHLCFSKIKGKWKISAAFGYGL